METIYMWNLKTDTKHMFSVITAMGLKKTRRNQTELLMFIAFRR